MLYSESKNFIYFRSRRTASTTMSAALSSECTGPSDVIAPLGFEDTEVLKDWERARRKKCGLPARLFLTRAVIGKHRRLVARRTFDRTSGFRKPQIHPHEDPFLVRRLLGQRTFDSAVG